MHASTCNRCSLDGVICTIFKSNYSNKSLYDAFFRRWNFSMTGGILHFLQELNFCPHNWILCYVTFIKHYQKPNFTYIRRFVVVKIDMQYSLITHLINIKF